MIIKFMAEPLTPLVFGKPQPYKYGGYAPTHYPLPPPSTVSGMIRMAIMEFLSSQYSFDPSKWEQYKELLGDRKNYCGMDWVLIGPYIVDMENHNVYYPVPLDLVRVGEKIFLLKVRDFLDKLRGLRRAFCDSFDDDRFTPLQVAYRANMMEIMRDEETKVSGIRGEYVISTDLMKEYLNNPYSLEVDLGSRNNNIVNVDEVAKKKATVGVSLDPFKKKVKYGLTHEGYLKGLYYIVEKVWFKKGWSIFFAIHTERNEIAEKISNALDDKILRLGGEGGLVHVRKINDVKILEEEKEFTISIKEMVKLVLTSSCIFEKNYVYPSIEGLSGFMIVEDLVSGWSLAEGSRRSRLWFCFLF